VRGARIATVEKSSQSRRCRWCGRAIDARPGPGRPRDYCKPSHRQRDYEARRRSIELGLSESELIVTRHDLDELHDLLYVLEAAIEDVENDLRTDDSPSEMQRALAWLLEAARPLVAARPLAGN
jgi:hypothetical protein